MMFARIRDGLLGVVLLLSATMAGAQAPPPPTPAEPTPEPPPPATAIAAKVNGQPIPEMAVFRSLMRVRPEMREQARKEVINFLVDNTIIDQYLAQLKIAVDQKDIDAHVQKIKDEAKKDNQDFTKMLSKLYLTEDDLRRELSSALRWDKFILQQGTDQVLKDVFAKNADMFNGSRVQARHILIGVKDTTKEAAQAKAVEVKKHIEAEVAQQVAKLPPSSDEIAKQKEYAKILDKTFADVAAKESTCPSKAQGGDLGYFPRVGAMVEPFSKVAFSLKPYQLSEPVATDFGYHLILPLDHKAGKDVKFEEVRPFVQEVFGERMREAILAQYKARSQIEIEEKKK
jgi:peptidyl-prolyl cis-trans isomerase C